MFYRWTKSFAECHSLSAGQSGCPNGSCAAYACPDFTKFHGKTVLDEISKINVKEAENGEILKKGTVYIAPGGKHMEVKKCPDGSHKIVYNDMPPIGGLKPCANITYDS